jgi:hypothetical protein
MPSFRRTRLSQSLRCGITILPGVLDRAGETMKQLNGK